MNLLTYSPPGGACATSVADGLIAPDPNRFTGMIERVAFAVAIAYVIFLAAAFASGVWLVDAHGFSIQTDFVNVWAAGRLALDGNPAAAYDWVLHKAVEEQGVGHPFVNYFGWHYPPIFLFIAAALSSVAYVPAFLAWLALTFPAYLSVARMIVGNHIGLFLACAFPGVLWNIAVGQNGFLTAALLGGALGAMNTRPLLAGVIFVVALLIGRRAAAVESPPVVPARASPAV